LNIHKITISKRLLPYLIFCTIGFLIFQVSVGCNKSDNPDSSQVDTFISGCGKVDSVKSATTGEISADIEDQDPNASYILEINSKRYVGNTNPNTPWTFFTGLPSGTYVCTWWVSGCSKGPRPEYKIPGPIQITIK
jgi:hypothetical protein